MVHPSRCSQIVIVLGLGLSLFCTSARAQAVFSAPKNISNNSDYSFTPQVASDPGGNIYVVWEDDTATNSNILFSCSVNAGATFSAPKNLSNSSGFSFDPRIAVDSKGAINVVYVDPTPGNKDIFFTRSTNGGVSFSPPKDLSNDALDSEDPQLAVDASGNISVVWRNRNITFGVFYANSTDGGTTFSPPVNLAANLSGSLSPQLALDATGNVDVVWQDDSNSQSDVSFSRSGDKGANFSAAKSLASNSFGPQLAIAADGSINIVSLNNTAGHLDVFFSRSMDNGATFSPMKNVSSGLAGSGSPQIALDAGGNLYVAWEEIVPPSTKNDVFFSGSTNGGLTFSAPLNLSNNSGDSTSPWLVVDTNGNVSVAWSDTTPGNAQTFFTQSLDHGATFAAPQNLSNDAGFSADALMAADARGNLNVVWDDDASGFNQIFFTQLPSAKKPNQPPQANAGADQIVNCIGHNCGLIKLDGSKSFDPDGDTLTFVWNDEFSKQVATGSLPQFTAPLGAHTYTLTVTDPGGLSSSAVTHVTVQDKTAPTLQVSLSPSVLRSRDGKLVKVTATINASDTCDPNPAVKLVSITSNDPADRGRHTRSDVQAVGGGAVPFGTDVRSFMLRAEGPEKGQNLVYTVTYSATDASGNTTPVATQVRVTNHKSGAPRDGAGNGQNGARDDNDNGDDNDRNHKDKAEHRRSER